MRLFLTICITHFYVITFMLLSLFFFFNDTATTEIYTLSLHDALPIYPPVRWTETTPRTPQPRGVAGSLPGAQSPGAAAARSEEHTSELQSRLHLVCRLLLEKKKKKKDMTEIVTAARLA